ncbi:NXPE family member 2 [Elysia marginata]|uniref:NXPE family member 2 n=1 Tax=Elysia marginata TaxID=1093978 RepID=A0AAV4HIX7_9GAST|nr:NXPE family member 2 [Elysia marginata]
MTGLCLCVFSYIRFNAAERIKLLSPKQVIEFRIPEHNSNSNQEPKPIKPVKQTQPVVKKLKMAVNDDTGTKDEGKRIKHKDSIEQQDDGAKRKENIKINKNRVVGDPKGNTQQNDNTKRIRNPERTLKNKEIAPLKTTERVRIKPTQLSFDIEEKTKQSRQNKVESQTLYEEKTPKSQKKPRKPLEEKPPRTQDKPQKPQEQKFSRRRMRRISMEEALSKFTYNASKECINECPRKADENPFSYASLCNFTTQARWSYSLQQADAELRPFLQEDVYVYPYEREYMSYPENSDPSYLPSAKKSRIVFQTSSTPGKVSTATCRLGETVTARLDLLDEAGRSRTSGGDEVRAWVGATHAHNGSKINTMFPRAMAPVVDLNNGSYRIDISCLWAGQSRLVVKLRYPREFVSLVIRVVRKGGSRFLGARFQKGAVTEEVPCLGTPNVPGRPCVCNMTSLNGGAPFYCARPLDSRLTCNDWVVSGTMTRVTPADMAATEGKSSMKKRESLVPTDHLVIFAHPNTIDNNGNKEKGAKPYINDKEINTGQENNTQTQLFIPSPSESCTNTNRKVTWTTNRPTGYWLNAEKTWISLICKEPIVTETWMRACLKDSSVWIIGDSNGVRLYYKVADATGLKRLDYGPMPFFDVLAQSNRQGNVKVHFSPHEHPLYVTKLWKQLDVSFMGVPDKIDAIPSKGRQFLIIHYFLHVTTMHLGLAHARLLAARDPILRLLARNPQAVVGIRGPHTVSLNADYDLAIGGDTLARHLIDIIREVFEDLQERVLFLDGWETSLSLESAGIHPMGPVAEEMTRKFFSFACDESMGNEKKKR